MSKPECPEPECGYNANMRELYDQQERPLVLESTRSRANVDAHRDYDDFNLDEELARLRRAVHEVKQVLARSLSRTPNDVPDHKLWHNDANDERTRPLNDDMLHAVDTLTFIAEAFDNIDENLVRLGPLPKAWRGAKRADRDSSPSEAKDESF